MKYIAIVVLFLIAWCAKKVEPVAPKIPFVLTTQPLVQTTQSSYFTKNAKIIWTSQITVTSQIWWRVVSLPVGLGAIVNQWQLLVQLVDTAWSTKFGLQRSQVAIDTANNTFDIQKQSLDKQIADTQLALQRAQSTATTVSWDTAKQLEKAQFDVQNSQNISWSTTQLQLTKLQWDLEKQKFDLETLRTSNRQTLANFVQTAQNINFDITNLVQDIATQTNILVWATEEFRNSSEALSPYLWAKDFNAKSQARNALVRLLWLQAQLKSLDTAVTTGNLTMYLGSYSDILDSVNQTVASVKTLLIASVPWWSFTQQVIDWLTAQFNGYASRSSGITSSITAQINWIKSFTSTYQKNEDSFVKQIASLDSQIWITTKTLQDAAFATSIWLDRTTLATQDQRIWVDIWLQSAQSNANFVSSTKDINLQSLQNSLKNAQIWLAENQFNQSKLRIASPITAIISDVLVDVGQDITPGTPLVSLASTSQEIEIKLTDKERDSIQVWQSVTIVNERQQTQWRISSLSRVWDKNWSFKAIVSFNDQDFSIGTFVDVRIPLSQWWVIIPLNAVKIVDINRGQIYLRDGTKIILKTVTLWQLFGDRIEIVDTLPLTYQLITSDVSNYDPSKMNLQIQ